MNKCILLLFLSFLILNGLDIATTIIGLHIGAAEANPATINMMERWGMAGAFAFKFLAVMSLGLLSLGAYQYAFRQDPKYLQTTKKILIATFSLGIICYIYIVCHNLFVIFIQRLI